MKGVSDALISVIVPIYNVEKHIKRCIDSIIKQSYDKLEILLIDDGSLDNCSQICDEYVKEDKRIKVFHKKNGGLSDARNYGLKHANGEYVIFIDSDDSVKETYVESLYNVIIADSSDIAICGNIDVYKDVSIERHPKSHKIYDKISAIKEVFYDNDIDTCAVSKLFKKELFDNQAFPVGKIFEDTWIMPRIFCECNKISVIPESLYFHYINSNSIVTRDFDSKRMDLYYNSLDVVKYVSEIYPDLEKAGICKITHSCISTAMSLVKSKITYKEYEKIVFGYVRRNIFKLLFDDNVSSKYKLGALSMLLGKYPFKFILSIYNRRRSNYDGE